MLRILDQKFGDEVHSFGLVVGVEGRITCSDQLEELFAILRVKGRQGCKHFVQYTAKAPPVAGLAIGALPRGGDHLRG